jgi:hypothetical protein
MKYNFASMFAILLLLFCVSPANAITLPVNICTNSLIFLCPGTPGVFSLTAVSPQALTTSFFEDGTCTPSCNFNAAPGDVLLNDGAAAVIIGDLLRFNGNSATLFSDSDDPKLDGDARDVGIPSPNPANQVTITESSTGPTLYTVNDASGLTLAVYTINSDPVSTPEGIPEPRTIYLTIAGGVVIFAKLRRKRA